MEVEMERYDIAIIGTGPAGLEAAITAKIRNKKIILFGNKNLMVGFFYILHCGINDTQMLFKFRCIFCNS